MAIETRTRMSAEAYGQRALAEPDRKWELRDGFLHEKPPMPAAHNWLAMKLGHLLMSQLNWSVDQVRVDSGRVHRPAMTNFIPDVFVVPTVAVKPPLDRADILETYDQPLPLVVEVWSRSTADYDVTEKLAAYQQRGDLEIWSVHPYERTLTAWRSQPDRSYESIVFRDGVMRPMSRPDVSIDLDQFFGDN